VKRRTGASPIVRLAGRITATLVALLVFVLVTIQFARVAHQNIALAEELSTTQADVTALQSRQAEQLRELRRLRDPEGAVPEIHDRLRLVRPNETIIFVSPAPQGPAANTP